MKSEAGYTLIETLAALVVLGLMTTGLVASLQIFGRLQMNVAGKFAATSATRSAQAELDGLLEGKGPFYSQNPASFTGEGQGFHFGCGGLTCSLEIANAGDAVDVAISRGGAMRTWRIPTAGETHLTYSGALTRGASWPPEAPERQKLRAIEVTTTGPDGEFALLKSRVWAEQSAVCAFDAVQQDCR